MAKPDAAAVAKILQELAQRMELERGNPYRARAHARAAENLSLSPEPLDRMIREGRLTEIPGIGDAIAAAITKIHETGKHSTLEALRAKAPDGVLAMLRIPGLRPSRVRKLYAELGIASIEALEGAARSDRLKSLKGYGPGVSGEGAARHQNEPPPAGPAPAPRRGRHNLRRQRDRPRASALAHS
jgi:DNA polymerase (family 10)